MVLTKAELIQSLQNEVRILVHLCGKVEPQMLDYRPTPKQRSTIELLRYLTMMGPVLVASIKAGSFLVDEWSARKSKAAAMGGVTTAITYFRTGEYYLNKGGSYRDFFPEVLKISEGRYWVDYAYHLAPINSADTSMRCQC